MTKFKMNEIRSALLWHNEELENVDGILKDRNVDALSKAAFREYKQRLNYHKNNLLMLLTNVEGK